MALPLEEDDDSRLLQLDDVVGDDEGKATAEVAFDNTLLRRNTVLEEEEEVREVR